VEITSREYQATKRRASEAKGVFVRPIDKKRWDRELETFLAVFNETFNGRVGVSTPDHRRVSRVL
jgi:hypothetical protein